MTAKKVKSPPYAKRVLQLRTAEQGLKEEYPTGAAPVFQIESAGQSPSVIEANLEKFATSLDGVPLAKATYLQVLAAAKETDSQAKTYLELLEAALLASAGPNSDVLAKTGLGKKARAKPAKNAGVVVKSTALKAKKASDKAANLALRQSKGTAVLNLDTGAVEIEATPAAASSTGDAASSTAPAASPAPVTPSHT